MGGGKKSHFRHTHPKGVPFGQGGHGREKGRKRRRDRHKKESRIREASAKIKLILKNLE